MPNLRLSPFPGRVPPPSTGAVVSVEGGYAVLTEHSVFGKTHIRMDAVTARLIARQLFLAAAELEQVSADEVLTKVAASG